MTWETVVEKLNQLLETYPLNSLDGDLFYCKAESLTQEDEKFFEEWMAAELPPPMLSPIDGAGFFEVEDLAGHYGESVLIEISMQQIESCGGLIFYSWERFLSKKKNLRKCPKKFYILDERVSYPTDKPSGKLKHYIDVIGLLDLLENNADMPLDGAFPRYIFLHKGRLDIPVEFTLSSIDEGLDGISIVEGIFSDESQAEQKKSILKECIYGLLSNVSESNRLEYLIANFGVFSERFNENFRLFISEFSFDEVRLEYEEKKREYIADINSVAADTQSKMMGIPVSMALLAFKMQGVTSSSSFFSNLFLLVGVFVYAVMMIFLIKNQNHTLLAIESEFGGQMRRLKTKYPDQYDDVSSVETDVENRIADQKKYFRYFLCALYSLVAVAAGWFFFTHIVEWLIHGWSWVQSYMPSGVKRSTIS
jgi:hypothetical protein